MRFAPYCPRDREPLWPLLALVIFVTVGTTHFPFDRLVASVETLDVDDEIVVQRGASRITPGNAQVIDFLSFEAVTDYVRRSRAVISHAGVGSIMVALSNGRRPIVVPRLARYGEAVDDHQAQIAAMLGDQGRVTALDDVGSLRSAVASALDAPSDLGLAFGPLVDVVAEEVRRAIRDGR